MQALRAHPFFASIDWTKLWTEPAPPLEAGLVKKDALALQAENQRWKDFGVAWDEMLSDKQGRGTDEIGWAPEAEVPPFLLGDRGYDSATQIGLEEGPMGEVVDYRLAVNLLRDEGNTATILGGTNGVNIPTGRSSSGTGSESSSEGSPVEDLGAAMEHLAIERGRSREKPTTQGSRDADL